MKKKIVIGLSVLLSACMLGACGSDPKTTDYNGYSWDDLEQENLEDLTVVMSLATYVAQGYDVEEVADAFESSYSIVISDAEKDAVDSWLAMTDECGAYIEYDPASFTVTKSGKTLTTDITLKCEGRDATFEVVYTYWNMSTDGISVNTNYTVGEKMAKAGLNTIISMSIVFLVLILISLIIYAFNIFPYLEKKKKEKEAAKKAAEVPEVPAPMPVPAAAQPQENLVDDTELVAVIAAAIAEYEGTSTSGFVVRSINRR